MSKAEVCANCRYHENDADSEPCNQCRITDGMYITERKHWQPKEEDNQTAKADKGKLKLTLVPRQIIKDIAKIREYGNKKYGDPENWKMVEKYRYQDATFRHFLAYLDDNKSVDEESGLPHLAHLATNIAFLCEMEKGE